MDNDITKCLNRFCHLKERCLRYVIEADEVQSYSMFTPNINDCDFFMEVHHGTQY